MVRIRLGLLLLSAAVVAVGVLGGWRVSVRFVSAGGEMRGEGARSLITTLPDASAMPDAGLLRAAPRDAGTGMEPAKVAAGHVGALHRPPANSPAGVVAPAVRRSYAGLRITFRRAWRPVTYEIRSPQKQGVRFLPATSAGGPGTLLEWDL